MAIITSSLDRVANCPGMIQNSPLMNTQPLSDTELDRLGELLGRFSARGAMNLETFDGFFSALIAGPDDVLPSEYLPEIWGDGMVNENTFQAQPVLQGKRFSDPTALTA